MRIQTFPHNSTRLHVSPCQPSVLGAQPQAGLPRFGPPHLSTALHNSRPPSSTACYGHPRSFGQPSRYMGVHGKSWVLDTHKRPRSLWTAMQSSGCPRSFVRSHAIVWTPSDDGSWTARRYVWTPTTSCGRPRKSLGAQTCGQNHAFWATTMLPVELHVIALASHVKDWATTKIDGRPTTAVLDIHTKLWTATRICGRSRMIVDVQNEATLGRPHAKHGRPSCVNGRP